MKKLMAVLLAGVLVLGGAVTAFAAPSPSTDSNAAANSGIIKDVSGDVTKDEIEITNDASYSESEVLQAAKDLGIDTSNLTVYFNGDIHLKSGKPFTGTATVTFNVSGMTADKAGYVLHWKDGTCRDVTTSKGSGTITATYNGFSPTAILVEKSAAAGSTSKAAGTSNSGKSPKTGEAPFTAMMLGIAAVAAAGMFISRRKFA